MSRQMAAGAPNMFRPGGKADRLWREGERARQPAAAPQGGDEPSDNEGDEEDEDGSGDGEEDKQASEEDEEDEGDDDDDEDEDEEEDEDDGDDQGNANTTATTTTSGAVNNPNSRSNEQLFRTAYVDAHPGEDFHHRGKGYWVRGLPGPNAPNMTAVRGPNAQAWKSSRGIKS